MKYFTSEKITDRITRIRDICGVFEYLVEGDESACLIDTGDGFGNIKEYVDSLTEKKYIVVLTHGHIDHANGAGLFDEVYMSSKDEVVYKLHSSLEMRQLRFSENEATKDIPVEEYNPIRTKAFLPLVDKQEFDLGGVTLQVVATPGHTPGMSMILINEEKVILFGDGCGQQVLLFDDYSSTISEYLVSLNYVKSLESRYDRIIRNHTNGESPKELLDNVIECCHKILAHSDAHQKVEFKGKPLFSAKLLGEDLFPLDKSEGNLLYRQDKQL